MSLFGKIRYFWWRYWKLLTLILVIGVILVVDDDDESPIQAGKTCSVPAGTLAWPIGPEAGTPVIGQGYLQLNTRDEPASLHEGIDIVVEKGTPVHAVEKGTVVALYGLPPPGNEDNGESGIDSHFSLIVETEGKQGQGIHYAHIDSATCPVTLGSEVTTTPESDPGAHHYLGDVSDFPVEAGEPAFDHLHLELAAEYPGSEGGAPGDEWVSYIDAGNPLDRVQAPADTVSPSIGTPPAVDCASSPLLFCIDETNDYVCSDMLVEGMALDIVALIGDQEHVPEQGEWRIAPYCIQTHIAPDNGSDSQAFSLVLTGKISEHSPWIYKEDGPIASKGSLKERELFFVLTNRPQSDDTGEWNGAWEPKEGGHTITVTVRDAKGNQDQKSMNVQVMASN